MDAKPSFTGRTRRHTTHWSVRIGEVVSRAFITIGGIGTILAVGLVCVFLAWVVVPLFLPASLTGSQHFPLPWKAEPPLRAGMDEYRLLGWALFPDGSVATYRMDNGTLLERRKPEGLHTAVLTACAPPSNSDELALGFADGSVQFGRVGFTSRLVEETELPDNLRELPDGGLAPFEGGILQNLSGGRFRAQKIKVELEAPVKPADPSAVLLIDQSIRPTGPVVSTLTADGKLRVNSVTKQENVLTGEITRELTGGELTLPELQGKGQPAFLRLAGVGDMVYLVWEDGRLLRVNARNLENPKVVEELNLLDEPPGLSRRSSATGAGVKLTALQFLIGKSTLLVGDSSGRVRAWFRVNTPNAKAGDGSMLVSAHEFVRPHPASGPLAVTALASSHRGRMMAAGYADGTIRLYNVTSERFVLEMTTATDQPITGLTLASKDDGILALTPASLFLWEVEPGYPEVTVKALFRPVWYEGYEKPEHVWQSSSGSDEFEPKFGLWPLVFGTLKATCYCLLLGVPLALLAAIYTTEFLHPRSKAIIKPTIELMAGLPSVVLGFLAALVLAPFVERWLPAVLAGFLTIPGTFLLGAYGWQLLPEKLSLRLLRWRFVILCLMLPLGCAAAVVLGPWLERLLFGGNLMGWLNGNFGSGVPGWFLLLIPVCAGLALVVMSRGINPILRRLTSGLDRFATGLADLGKFTVGLLLTLGLAWLLACLLTAAGWDPRGSFLGTYVQRNALVVGFMMGFAIIPIIYTIAEDALSLVPEHLRSASLGCGATPWQTAVRVIIPTAMSGLFSAVMIGLGRAVGETMIVLMAAGNAPVLEMNIFNGFRTLSANIAVELPEAVRDSTHYRTLFLAALTLFVMTFILNTIAELVRLRFRKRSFQL